LKLKPNDDELKKMLVAIDQQELRKKETDFVPHPATWLNDRRWEDEITQPNVNAAMGRRVL
jgi:fido (protein-threonine AMPylation protein)